MSELEDDLARAHVEHGDTSELLEAVDEVLARHEVTPARAALERASARDALGREADAVGLYREALAGDLAADERHRCLVQLGSSLRNVGATVEAVEVLRSARDEATGPRRDEADAFLALALHSDGRGAEALALALQALAPHLERYARPVAAYADELDRG